MEFVVITDLATGLPRMLNIAHIIGITGNGDAPPKAVFHMNTGGLGSFVTATQSAQDVLTRAITKGVAADLRT